MSVMNVLLVLAGAIAAYRIVMIVRKVRDSQQDDWDERLVKNLRAQGGDPFSPYEVDFFFDLPDAPACEKVAAALQLEAYAVDYRQLEPDRGVSYTLHARKKIRVSVPDMQGLTRSFGALAAQHGGRYDGWVTAGISREALKRR
jgi:regulator of RNase E activity RraB